MMVKCKKKITKIAKIFKDMLLNTLKEDSIFDSFTDLSKQISEEDSYYTDIYILDGESRNFIFLDFSDSIYGLIL